MSRIGGRSGVGLQVDAQHVAWITLRRPERHNALIPSLLLDLTTALDDARAQSPRALVLKAEGRSFSTGGDVAAFFAQPQTERAGYARTLVGLLNTVILSLLRFPCPTLAVVNGAVTGGSLGLVLACDLALASRKASVAPWYTRVGFSPDGGWSVLVPERIGRARALAIQLTNETLDAERAKDLGLFSHLAAADALGAETESLLQTLLSAQEGSVTHTLELLRPDAEQIALELDREQARFIEQIATPEAEAGMGAFLSRPGRRKNNQNTPLERGCHGDV